jgi:microcystin-dependent protein
MPSEIQVQEDEPILPIKLHAGSYPPMDYAYCEGQVLDIGNYPDLYNVIGNVYGGDGVTTFAIPDLRQDEKDYNGVRFIISLSGTSDDMDFISAIAAFNGADAPQGWFFCEGQLIGLEYSNLFSLIGTLYGGDGKTNFGLPDLRNIGREMDYKYCICYQGVYPGRN